MENNNNLENYSKLNNYLSTSPDEVMIDEDLLNVAITTSNCHMDELKDINDAFLFFSSINYLNFAVKKRKEIGYRFKNRIEKGVNHFIKYNFPIRFYLNIEEYKNSKMSVLYVAFDNFIFSFHQVKFYNQNLINYLRCLPAIKFDNIRKQPKAGIILRHALMKKRGW